MGNLGTWNNLEAYFPTNLFGTNNLTDNTSVLHITTQRPSDTRSSCLFPRHTCASRLNFHHNYGPYHHTCKAIEHLIRRPGSPCLLPPRLGNVSLISDFPIQDFTPSKVASYPFLGTRGCYCPAPLLKYWEVGPFDFILTREAVVVITSIVITLIRIHSLRDKQSFSTAT